MSQLSVLPQETFSIGERIAALAATNLKTPSAISLYFQSLPGEGKGNAIRLKDLLREAATEYGNRAPEPWKKIVRAVENWAEARTALHVLFVCTEQNIWEEFDIPVRSGPTFAKADRIFHIVPLLQQVQSVVPLTIALVERERARFFSIEPGNAVRPLATFHDKPWQSCAHDSRVGWSAHNEHHKEVHHGEFLERVAEELSSLEKSRQILVGCRDDVWSELSARLSAQVKERVVGKFVIPSMEMDNAELLGEAERMFKEHCHEDQKALLERIRENTETLTGFHQVVPALNEGAVRELVLAAGVELLHQCMACGSLNLGGVCSKCSSRALQAIDADEGLVRAALARKAKVSFLPGHLLAEFGGVAAFTRFRVHLPNSN